MYAAQEWFDNFNNKFIQTRQKDKNFGFKVTRQEYTRLMMNFLEELGKQQGFKVNP